MKLDKTFAESLRISTKGMTPYEPVRHLAKVINTGLFDELKVTQCFQECGQLHRTLEHTQQVGVYVCYIHREDGEIYLMYITPPGQSGHYEMIKTRLDPQVRAEVIVTQAPASEVERYGRGYLNPECGPLEFLAQHHPSHTARVAAIAKLMEMYPEPQHRTGKELSNYRAWLRRRAKELGIPCA